MDTGLTESRDSFGLAMGEKVKGSSNAHAPISRLPPEVLAATFSLLCPSAWNKEANHWKWIRVTHVCRQWRETALNDPRLWSHINFTRLTLAAMAEILVRAKTVPLHLEGDVTKFGMSQSDTFERQLDAHTSHFRHLSITGCFLPVLQGLVSSAPILEFLSLSRPYVLPGSPQPELVLPVNLFNCTTPSLKTLELVRCDISWKSSLLKGLQTLKILNPSVGTRPKLEDWLDALNEMPQLETLIFQYATPVAPLDAPLISESSRRVTLPSLTRFQISALAKDCVLAFAYLVLPALAWLHVNAKSCDEEGEDVRLLIPYVARNINGLLGTEPLRSVLINGETTRAEVVAWTTSDADVEDCNLNTFSASAPACLMFAATSYDWLDSDGVDTAIYGALFTLLPMNSVSTLIARNDTQLSKGFWMSHAPGLPLLEQVRLAPTTVKGFRDMLAEDAPPDGPRLPSLTKLILTDITWTEARTCHLRDMLIERVEQGVPLEVLDLRTCIDVDWATTLLQEIVVDVQEPLTMQLGPPMIMGEFEYDDGEGEAEYGEEFVDYYDDFDFIT